MSHDYMNIIDWFLHKLEVTKDKPAILVRDSLHMLPERASAIHTFASENGYTVIVAATNLAFRELYERAIVAPETQKLLVIDRTPKSRRITRSSRKAPPLFYPDLLARVSQEARIDLDMRQFLKDVTGDQDWPQEANEPNYVRLILSNLKGVLKAHENLRIAQRERFSDNDFQTIVAYAALDVADSAFQKLDDTYYWRVGLHGYQRLEELETIAPAITKPIREDLAKAPAPFSWFGQYDTETVIRAFYLSVILSQHLPNWKLLLTYVDPALKELTTIEQQTLEQSASKLIGLDPDQAQADIDEVEASLNRKVLSMLLIDQLAINDLSAAAKLLEQEHYSTLFRSLALCVALEDLLSPNPDMKIHQHIRSRITTSNSKNFVDSRLSLPWSNLKEAYNWSYQICEAHAELEKTLKKCKVNSTDRYTFLTYRDHWNSKGINRLEYYLSALKRLVDNQMLLPCELDLLPTEFASLMQRLHAYVRDVEKSVIQHINELNRHFQELIAQQYPQWLTTDTDIRLSSHFIRRCLKPYWDPKTEKAVVLVFDGMRYDIWDELLRPTLLEKLTIKAEFPASALLPSETHVSRWAIAAGREPDTFGLIPRRAESDCLKEALERELNYHVNVETAIPEGSGTGETVRYKAGNLEYYIFEFCDKELHKIALKELPDGRREPSRPLAFVYQQYVKNLIDTEVMSIIRRLKPNTKVFITADHGFGLVGQEYLRVDPGNLNEPNDCVYLNCLLSVPVSQANLSYKVRNNIISFTPEQLHYPKKEMWTRRDGIVINKEYKAVIFPKVGYSFSRQGSRYTPDAYGHGGISLQELIIPMVVLEVKTKDEETLTLESIIGPREVIEGEEVEFRMPLRRRKGTKSTTNDLRVDIEGSYSGEDDQLTLPQQVLYMSKQDNEVVYRFKPDTSSATADEHRAGIMKRDFTLVVRYTDGNRVTRKTQKYTFAVRLNSERIIRRVPTALGNILGLTPKSMR
jgi:PglZ domain